MGEPGDGSRVRPQLPKPPSPAAGAEGCRARWGTSRPPPASPSWRILPPAPRACPFPAQPGPCPHALRERRDLVEHVGQREGAERQRRDPAGQRRDVHGGGSALAGAASAGDARLHGGGARARGWREVVCQQSRPAQRSPPMRPGRAAAATAVRLLREPAEPLPLAAALSPSAPHAPSARTPTDRASAHTPPGGRSRLSCCASWQRWGYQYVCVGGWSQPQLERGPLGELLLLASKCPSAWWPYI